MDIKPPEFNMYKVGILAYIIGVYLEAFIMLAKTRSHNPNMLHNFTQLALPVALQTALVACLSLADVLMVSGLGHGATASVGAASKWHFVIIMIMAGLANANGSLVAQYWGKGNIGEAKSITVITLINGVKLLLPISLCVGLFSKQMMSMQSDSSLVISVGSEYLLVSLPMLILTHFVIGTESSMRASGQTWLPLFMAAFTIFLNIGLNHWFIHGGAGVPALGVAGAALATTVARVIQLMVLGLVLLRMKHWLLFTPCTGTMPALRTKYRKLAVPLVFNSLLWAIGTLSYQIIFGRMGTEELAVFSMLGPFESLSHSLFFGMGVACSVVVGQQLGQDNFDQAYSVSIQFIAIALVGSLAIGLVIILNNATILSWLNLDQPEVLPIAKPALLIMAGAMWLKMLNLMVIHGVLRAGGENKFCLRTDFLAMWLFGLPLTAIAAFWAEWPFHWVYAVMFVEEAIKIVLCFRHYFTKAWQNNLTAEQVG
ncbi:MATE family efflux transporter [Agarivorans aestuarii]|uniref:MATE family efflux transporter n=1 Tax=Agarivorans aestuarii TaxID=1563703 RepID=UPI001C821947|nr:MATE family efflux transporter [Agarivorans aestuarii]